MLLFLPILLLLVVPLVLLVIRLVRPRFAYSWLIAAMGVMAAWLMVLLARLQLPATYQLATWEPREFFPTSPFILSDAVSWPFALAMASLALAAVLTDVVRVSEVDWIALASSLSITALGLVGVMAGNLLTLLLAWVALDIIELLILLSQVLQSEVRVRLIAAFLARLAGIIMVIWAVIITRSETEPLSFQSITPQISIFLLLAAGLRLGVLPLYRSLTGELPLRRGLGMLLHLAPAASSLMLLTRTASIGAPPALSPYLLGFAGLAALYGAVSWATADHELDGRQYWILGLAGFSLASAVRAQPAASQAWSLAMLLSGGLLFLASTRRQSLLPLGALGLLGIAALPYTPAWQGALLFNPPYNFWWFIFLIAQALFLAGYARYSLQFGQPLAGAERWVWVIYPAGLALLPLVQNLITWWIRIPKTVATSPLPSLAGSWPVIVSLFLAGAIVLLRNRFKRISQRPMQVLHYLFSLGWLYQLLWNLYRALERAIAFINLILEGEAGILWTLLLLTLLLSMLVQQGL